MEKGESVLIFSRGSASTLVSTRSTCIRTSTDIVHKNFNDPLTAQNRNKLTR